MIKNNKITKKQGSISIELLPEFGFLLNGEPVYGPGSVFQGVVRLSLPSQHNAQRLRIVFHAAESVQLHSTMASVIRGRHHQLFGTQRILWEKSEQQGVPCSQYMFTIQMPMIQHPPSMDYSRLRYKCRFKLTAILDHTTGSFTSSLQPLLTAHHTVHYRPWVATRALKVPMVRHSKWLVVQLLNSDYIAGDTCQLQVTLSPSALASCLKSSLVGMQVIMELVQIATLPCQLEDERVPPSETVITRSMPIIIHSPPASLLLLDQQQQQPSTSANTKQQNYRRESISSSAPSLVQACIHTSTRLSMDIPNHIPPTFNYGRVINLQYELVLKVSGKKRNRPLWASAFTAGEEEIRIPLVIGTLGHGIRVPEDVKNYTNFSGIFGDTRSTASGSPDETPSSTSHTLSRVNTSASSGSVSSASATTSSPSTDHTSTSNYPNDSASITMNGHDHRESSTTVPAPKFLQTVEYENALPIYHPSTLPPYTPSAATGSIHSACAISV